LPNRYRSGNWAAAGVGISLVLLWPGPVAAHPVLMTYVTHRVTVTPGPVNIDVQVELTFNEYPSLSERRRMDADHNGRIDASEMGLYTQSLVERTADAVTLAADGRDLELVPLYTPELGLQGADQVVPVHHVLRLFYFARTPEGLHAGSEFVLEDKLWPGVPSITVPALRGGDGFRGAVLESEPPGGEAEPRRSCFRMEVVPAPHPVQATMGEAAGAHTPLASAAHHRSRGLAAVYSGVILPVILIGAIWYFGRAGIRRRTKEKLS
jgi:hypothetical protein